MRQGWDGYRQRLYPATDIVLDAGDGPVIRRYGRHALGGAICSRWRAASQPFDAARQSTSAQNTNGKREMPAYIITYRESPVRDQAAIEEYSRRNRENAAAFQEQFGIRPLVVYGASEGLEGDNPDGIVILRFPTMEDARAWYESPEYQEAIAIRRKAADWRVVIVDGLPG